MSDGNGYNPDFDTRGKACPHMLGESCKGPECAMWERMRMPDSQAHGEFSWVQGCGYKLQTRLLYDQNILEDRTRAVSEAHGNEARKLGNRLLSLAERSDGRVMFVVSGEQINLLEDTRDAEGNH